MAGQIDYSTGYDRKSYFMSIYVPTLKQLQYLTALQEHGHFGNAAEACFVTQSTLSAGLRELESLLELTLVERTRRVVRFTPVGELIAKQARRVLAEAENLTDLARTAGKPLSGELRMGVIPTIAPFLLPRLLPKLRADWPDLKLYLREEVTAAACDSLQRGRLDCVLLALPYRCGEVDSAELFEDKLFLAFQQSRADDYPLRIPSDAIDERSLLLLEDGHCLKDHALAACNRPDLGAEATMLGTSLHTLVQMVDNGLGVTLLPEMAIEAGILNGTGVIVRPLDTEKPSRRIALAWRKGSPRTKEFALLADALRNAA
jgi:LysR family hydrogen peroxide-inducible transcriptional activator